MKKRNFKGRCEKRILAKCKDVCRTFDPISYAYADMLERDDEIEEIRCNVMFDDPELKDYTTDFVCTKVDGEVIARECVERKYLTKPMTIKLLEASREYWERRNVKWGVVTNEAIDEEG